MFDFDDHFNDLPRISLNTSISRRKTIYKPSPRSIPTSFAPHEQEQSCYDQSSSDDSFDLDFLIKSPPPQEFESGYSGDSPELFMETGSIPSSCSCGCSSSVADINTDVKKGIFSKSMANFDAFDTIPSSSFSSVLKNPTKSNHIPFECSSIFSISPKLQEIENLGPLSIKIVDEETVRFRKGRKTNKRAARLYSSLPSGIKLRTNTRRISSKKIQGQQQRRRVSNSCNSKKKRGNSNKDDVFESFDIVKTSSDDPERDFKESMMEMIVENNIRASKDLEDLLACYLTLNSNEYHQLIMNAFDHIWFSIHDFYL